MRLSQRVANGLHKVKTAVGRIPFVPLEVPESVLLQFFIPLLRDVPGVQVLKNSAGFRFLFSSLAQLSHIVDPACHVALIGSEDHELQCKHALICSEQKPATLRYSGRREVMTLCVWAKIGDATGVPLLEF